MPQRISSKDSTHKSVASGLDMDAEAAIAAKRNAPTKPLRRGSTHNTTADLNDNDYNALSAAAASTTTSAVVATESTMVQETSDQVDKTPPRHQLSNISHSTTTSSSKGTDDRLWSVDDLLSHMVHRDHMEPLLLDQPGKRLSSRKAKKRRKKEKKLEERRRRQSEMDQEEGEEQKEDDNLAKKEKEIALLPRNWTNLVVLPVQFRGKLVASIVLAKTTELVRSETPIARGGGSSSVSSHAFSSPKDKGKNKADNQLQEKLLSQEHVTWWAPHVSGLCHEFLLHDTWLHECEAQSQAIKLLREKLYHSDRLRRHMLHSALPLEALRLLHVDMSGGTAGEGAAGFQDSSTSLDVSEITSRYGLLGKFDFFYV